MKSGYFGGKVAAKQAYAQKKKWNGEKKPTKIFGAFKGYDLCKIFYAEALP